MCLGQPVAETMKGRGKRGGHDVELPSLLLVRESSQVPLAQDLDGNFSLEDAGHSVPPCVRCSFRLPKWETPKEMGLR